ncbi:progestin and adipoQ receptor family member 3 isoform X1 [Pelobates cultripes]|uniref:Progestin and adipoQ receptor family member 3 isoform X1 n=1 Tax=Pelobates cultripes TaxID=61616 RepID=A0AAD1SIR0_PELCU|nr:progestin and adipoQ receptor family member 3 isoform X1 [Pelobates cultripes]
MRGFKYRYRSGQGSGYRESGTAVTQIDKVFTGLGQLSSRYHHHFHHASEDTEEGIRLYTYEQIPVFLKDNPYITDGYRAYLPSRLCLKSLFILSNESVNIWSHLLGFLLFFSLGIYDMMLVLPSVNASREDFVICSICLFCFQVCMLCSVGYHLFCCHRSEKTSRRWMALDYAGISIGILGCYVSGVFYAFYCNNYWRQVYLITVLAMILAVFFAQIHPSYLTQQWHRLRSVIFCSVSGYGIIPTIHWIWLNGGLGASIVQEFAPRVIVMYMIAASAFLFYISKVPERYFPGQLNYLGSSHQLWHILAVVMLYWWHQSTVHIMQYRHSQPCPASRWKKGVTYRLPRVKFLGMPSSLAGDVSYREAVSSGTRLSLSTYVQSEVTRLVARYTPLRTFSLDPLAESVPALHFGQTGDGSPFLLMEPIVSPSLSFHILIHTEPWELAESDAE